MESLLDEINLAEELVKHYSVSQATRILGVSRQTMMKWIGGGKFANVKKGGENQTDSWKIPAEEVERVRQERVAELDAKIEEMKEQRRLILAAKIELN